MKKLFFIKKKGFTLIELLAVIVILAIILLIVMPIVLNVINDAKKGAFESSAMGLIKTAENECFSNLVKGTTPGEREIYFEDWEIQAGEVLGFSGKGAKEGIIVVNSSCEVVIAIHDGTWCARKQIGSTRVTLTDLNEDNCELDGGESLAGTPADYFIWETGGIGWSGDERIGEGVIMGFCNWGWDVDNPLPYVNEVVIPSTYNCPTYGEVPVTVIGPDSYGVCVPPGGGGYKDSIIDVFSFIRSIIIPSVDAAVMAAGPFNARELISVEFSNTLEEIQGSETFANNELTSLIIPDSITTLGWYDIFKNNNLTDVTIGNGLSEIPYGAFANNDLVNITIPSNITSIGEYAFSSNQLASVIIPNSITNIADGAFSDNPLNSVTILNSETNVGNNAFVPIPFENINWNGKTTSDYWIMSDFINGLLIGAIAGSGVAIIPEVVDETTVTQIGNNAFWGGYFTSITFPSTVTTIGGSAFRQNYLEEIIFLRDATTIGSGAFSNNGPSQNSGTIGTGNRCGRWTLSGTTWTRVETCPLP